MALSSQGTLFTTGGVVGEVTAISVSGVSVAEIDVTALADTVKKYVTGTLDGGTVEITANFTAAPTMPQHGAETPSQFTITWGGSVAQTFYAFIVGMSIDASVDQQVVVKYTLRVSHQIMGVGSAPA
jgi:hypothetical protein